MSGHRVAALLTFRSVSSGIDLAFSLEPVIDLAAWRKAALLCSAVCKVADPLVPFGRGQPVWHQKQRPDETALCDRRIRSGLENGRFRNRQLRLNPWNPCACNFTRHKTLSGRQFPAPRAWAQHFSSNNGL